MACRPSASESTITSSAGLAPMAARGCLLPLGAVDDPVVATDHVAADQDADREAHRAKGLGTEDAPRTSSTRKKKKKKTPTRNTITAATAARPNRTRGTPGVSARHTPAAEPHGTPDDQQAGGGDQGVDGATARDHRRPGRSPDTRTVVRSNPSTASTAPASSAQITSRPSPVVKRPSQAEEQPPPS